MKTNLRLIAITLLSGALSAAAHTTTVTTPSGARVVVEVLNPNVIRVSNCESGTAPAQSRASVLDGTVFNGVTTATLDGGNVTYLTTSAGVSCAIDRTTGAVTINGGANRIVTDNGVRTMADGERSLRLYTTAAGSFYGAGERGHRFNLRGDTLVNYNRQNYGYTGSDPRINQMNITMPLFVSTDGFALVFDDYAASRMVLSNPIEYISESPSPISYYYVQGGATMADLVTNLTELTGRQPLTPLWSLGYITSKYGYHDEAETRGTIDTLKRNGYPVDGIVLDLYWYGKEQDMGRLAWDPVQWPNPEKMLRDLKKQGVNLVAISQPYVLRNSRAIDNYRLADSLGMFVQDTDGSGHKEVTIWVGEGGMWDVSNPATRAWLAERYRALTDGGVTGWWGDLGEPEVHPEGAIHANGLTTRQYHNQYGNDWSEIISDLFASHYPDTRLMTMMRGGTTGLQRYSVYPWSTDVSRSWGGLDPQVVIMLNSGLSGLGYMGHDVGGFAVDPANPYDPELYVRWLQLGAFSPILRTHAQYAAEPYGYPDHQPVIKALIKDRYRWLPYNYTLAYENAVKGWPLVRPLNFHAADADGRYDAVRDQFLWGENVLVAPVMTAGTTERPVALPAGRWYDYNHPATVYAGDTVINYPAPLEVLPMFVRAGAFLPQADYVMANTGDYNPARLTVKHYMGSEAASFTMYDDDRMSAKSLADGAYRLTGFASVPATDSYTVVVSRTGSYTGAPAHTDYTFVFYGVDAQPATVLVNGRKARKYSYNTAQKSLTVSGRDIDSIEIKY